MDWRLFIALPIPTDIQATVAARRAELHTGARVRWVRPETLHVTLRFLGDRTPEEAVRIGRALRTTLGGFGPVEVEVAGGGAFPTRGRPRVLWVSIAGELTALAEAVDSALARLGEPRANKPFSPHLTIGRVQRGDARDAARQLRETGLLGRFTADRVVLYRSELRAAGARHTPLAEVGL